MAQNQSLIYYGIMVNDVYAFFQTQTNPTLLPSCGNFPTTSTQFPTTLSALTNTMALAKTYGKTISDANALAIEVKTSWIEVTKDLANPNSYITMQGSVPVYTQTAGTQTWTATGSEPVNLAMVGLHIAGSVNGHPEMIWATFEHFGNTPNARYQYIDTTGTTQTMVPMGQTTGLTGQTTWLFNSTPTTSPGATTASTGSTGPFNVPHLTYTSASTTNSSASIALVSGQTKGPSDTIRWKPFGAASNVVPNTVDKSVAASNTEIISINNSIIGMLQGNDVRKNYYLVGATWTTNGTAPSSGTGGNVVDASGNLTSFSGNQVGTSMLSNSTMETYFQGSSTQQGIPSLPPPATTPANPDNNCLTCHNSTPPPSTTTTTTTTPPPTTATTFASHIFSAIHPLTAPKK
jgi:hypothetical protein